MNTNNTEFVTSYKIDFLHKWVSIGGGGEATIIKDG